MTQNLPTNSASRCYFSGFSVKKVCTYLFCLSCLISCFLLSSSWAYATEINENFEGYSLGTLNGQGTWAGNAGDVVNTTAHGGSQSAFFYKPGISQSTFTFDSLGSSVVEFWAYPGTGAYQKIIDFYLQELGAGIRFECYFHNCDVGNGWSVYSMSASGGYGPFLGYVPAGSWQKFQMEFDATTKLMRFYLNGTMGGWLNLAISASSFHTALFFSSYAEATGIYFDDIRLPYTPTSAYRPVLTPTWPVDCVFNATDTFSGTATGKLETPATMPLPTWWNKLSIGFSTEFSGTTSVASTTFLLGQGEEYNYSIPFTIATGTYNYIYYSIGGYEDIGGSTYFPMGWGHNCEGTGYGTAATPTAPELVIPPPEPSLEDCSGYDLLQRLVCEVKNMVAGIFVPSPSKVAELRTNIEMVKQKAPYTYLIATKEFLGSLNASLTTSTPSIVLSMFGATGTLNFAWAEATTTIAGGTYSFKDFLRAFFVILLIWKILVPWEMKFLSRVFK